MTLARRILALLAESSGLTDREITDALFGHTAGQQPVNSTCRRLQEQGRLARTRRPDGLIGNYLIAALAPTAQTAAGVGTEATEGPAGDSSEQRAAETLLIATLSKRLGVQLIPKRYSLPEGGRLEFDGWCENPPIICEAWAHIGPAKSAQKNKLAADALKLVFAARFMAQGTRRILILADRAAASHLGPSAWMTQALKAFGVEIEFVDLPQEVVEGLRKAQKRQFR